MAFLKMIRRRLYKPVLMIFLITFVWYSAVLILEGNMEYNNEDDAHMIRKNIYHVKREKTNIGTLKQDKALQHQDIDQVKNQQERKHNSAEDNEMNELYIDSKIDGLNSEQHETPNKNDFKSHNNDIQQIISPLKELPKIAVMVKDGLGEYGKPANISKDTLNEHEKEEFDLGWKNNAFNEFISNRISLNRTLPDPRDERCKLIKYSDDLPDTSVIVTFHNEAWTVLLRSVHSIVNRTPAKLLKEIILVDDYSDMAHLQKPLEEYMSSFPHVKIVRAQKREGLIRTRLLGYRAATGSVLVFLDSHIECADGWLEPMLDRIKQNWTTVVTPVIDVIHDNTFELLYQGAKGTNVGGFDWNLVFTWHSVPDEERKRRNYEDHLPVRSPTMAGGLFAISREYFATIGTYDDGMDIWGAENLEISFRIWMCGGTLETTPCSHVGHIFRKRTPYKWRENVNVLLKNNVRLAEVWLDDYKKYYYDRIGNNLGDFGNITSRIELRKRLKCKSFEWYLKYVYPEMWVPGESTCHGLIKAKKHTLCLSGEAGYSLTGKTLSLVDCQTAGQFWYLTYKKEIKRDYGCFDYSGKRDIIVEACHLMGGNQIWEYREDNTIYHAVSKKCLEISDDGKNLLMNDCIGTDNQIWYWNRQKPDGPVRNWER